MSRVGEIYVEKVDKINAGRKTTGTAASVHRPAAAGAGAQLGGIDAAAAQYIERVHQRLAAEEAAAAAAAAK
ncbi:unnamed protein product [Alopecurus aequalis]